MENAEDKCQECEENRMQGVLHECPFKGDVYGDWETLCNCCEECMDICRQDI